MSKDFPRVFGGIQKQRRIAIPESLLDQLGWKIDDEIMISVYRGKLIVENLTCGGQGHYTNHRGGASLSHETGSPRVHPWVVHL